MPGCYPEAVAIRRRLIVRRMISHRHRCIFAHVPKTGGKAVLSAFDLPMLGRDYDGRRVEIEEPYGHHSLQNYAGRTEFAYFKFAFVRNPWDRLVSAFAYLMGGGCNDDDARFRDKHLSQFGGDFSAFVRRLPQLIEEAPHFRPQIEWLCDRDGKILTNFLGRFERLQTDFSVVAEQLNIPGRLPVLNASVHRPYREYYDDRTRDIVAAAYRSDIRAFGYEF